MATPAPIDSGLLLPILVAGYGRSGTTVLMALLGTDERVAFDRRYLFENRYLTYLAKLSLLAGGAGGSPHLGPVQLHDFTDGHFGAMPWPTGVTDDGTPTLQPSRTQWIEGLWRWFSASVRRRRPRATHYAEKVPAWLAATVREVMPCRVIHLVRDPRDVFISAHQFSRVRPLVGFGMEPGTSDLEQARHTAHGLLTFAENELTDRTRSDCCLVRYEDWANNPEAVAARLNGFLGLEICTGKAIERHLDGHATSPNLGATIGRWRREPLPPAVRMFLDTHLAVPFRQYGYEIEPEVRPAVIAPGPGMPSSADGAIVATSSGVRVDVVNGDFWIDLPIEPVSAARMAELWICLRGTTGDHCSVYWHGPGESYGESRSAHVEFHPGPHWQILRFRLEAHPLWEGRIHGLRIDLFNGRITPGAAGEVRWLRMIDR